MHSGSISILKIGMLDIRAPWITTDIGSKDVKDQSEESKDEGKGIGSPDKQDNAESKIEMPAAEVDHEKGKEKEHERDDKGKEKEEEGDDESADRSTIEEGAPAEEMSMQQEILNHLETKLFFWKDSKEMKMDDELYQKYCTRAATSFPNPVKCGTLTKQGKIHKTWRERYFVLEESILFYYDSPKSERPNGVIDLNGCEVLKDVTRGKKNCFQVSHTRKKETSRTFVFFAKTAEEMKSWISVLNAATRTRKPCNPRAVDPRRLSSQPRLRLPKDDTAAVGPLHERPASARPHQKARAKSFSSTQKVRPTSVSAREFVAGAHRKSSMLAAGYEEEEGEEGDVVTIVEEVSTPYVEPELEKETEKEKEKEKEQESEEQKKEEEEHKDKEEGKEKEVAHENNEDGSWKEPEPREDVEPPKITFLTESKTEKNQLSEETIEKYMSLAEENEAKLLAQVEPHGSETKSWKLVKEIENILVSKRDVSGSSHFLTRVEGRIRAPVDKIMSLIRTLEYDPLTISVTEVARVNENMDLSHLCMRAPSAIVSDRDFSVLRFKRRNTATGGWVLCAVSVETELIPEDGSYVRGHVIHSGWVIEPFGTEGKESFCTYVLGLDPKGWAPIWLLNMFRTTNMFQSFTHLKAKCEAQPKKGSSS